MSNSRLFKNIISLVSILGIIFFAIWYIARTPDESGEEGIPHVGVSEFDARSGGPADEFSSLLNRLKNISFEKKTIFNDPLFKSELVSFRRELPFIDQARQNPFAPVEGNPSSYIHYRPATGATSSLSSFLSGSTTSQAGSSSTTPSTTPGRLPGVN